jgi:cation diffusion facilitator family transporter
MSNIDVSQETGDNSRYQEMKKVTLVGSAVDFVLAVIKLIFGYIGQSQALIADGIHSLSDLFTDFMVLYAAKHASRDADETHPYGHERIETITTVALGIALIIVAVGIGWDAGARLFNPEELLQPGILALVIAAISVIAKEAIYHYTARAARRLRSKMLQANAWHSRTDAISSIVVVIGVAGSMAGLNYLDAIAAIGVAIIIAKVGWELVWNSLHELADTALDMERVAAIRKSILSIGDVKSLHMLRTRSMGGNALVDVHIQVEPKLSISEGHQISETVRNTLINEIDEVADVMVHIDPEDDEATAPNKDLPLRDEILAQLNKYWQDIPQAAHITNVTLHYLDGKIHVEILLPLSILDTKEEAGPVAQRLSNATNNIPEIGDTSVHFC